MVRLRRCLGLIACSVVGALALSMAAVPALAQTRLDLTAGFDHNIRTDAWVPLLVRISNAGSNAGAQLNVTVRTRNGTQTYSSPVRLRASTSSQQQTVYFHYPDISETPEVVVQLVADGRTVAERKLDNSLQLSDGQPAVIALTQDLGGLSILQQINLNYRHFDGRVTDGNQPFGGGGPTPAVGVNGGNNLAARVLYPRPETLPDNPNAYRLVDVVILGNLPLDLLSEDQWNAIVTWVKDGGILVVSGGADVNRLRSRQLAELLPMSPTGVRQVSKLPSLGYQYGVEPKLTSTALVSGDLKPDALALCQQDGAAVVSERKTGNGLVVLTSFDLLAPEFRRWPGQAGMWREIFSRGGSPVRAVQNVRVATEPMAYNRWGGPDGGGALADALAGVQSTEAPKFTLIGLFLVLYIICLVPVNYFVLRLRDRKEMAWITIPAIIFLFSAGAYAIGYKIKGGQLYLNYCTVIEGTANEDGYAVYAVASIFSPRQARYDLSIADPTALSMEVTEGSSGAARGGGDFLLVRDQKTTVRNATVNMWDHRSFDFQGHTNLGGSVLSSVVSSSRDAIVVKLTNQTKFALSECAVSYSGSMATAGNLAPGESKQVKLLLNTGLQTAGMGVISSEPDSKSVALRQIKEALAGIVGSPATGDDPNNPPRPFVFTGWFRDPVVGIGLENETPHVEGLNLLVVHLKGKDSGRAKRVADTGNPPEFRPDPFSANGIRAGSAQRTVVSPPIVPGQPGSADWLNSRAYALANSGDLDGALRTAKQALAKAPNDGNILDSVAEMYQRRKEYDKAAQFYAQALRAQSPPGLPETHFKFGETELARGKRTNGVAQLRAAAQRSGDPFAAQAAQKLASLGVSNTPQVAISVPPATGPITILAQGQKPPAPPGSGKGARRYLQPVAGGGHNYVVQRWDNTNGHSVSMSTQYIAPGDALPQ